MALLRTRPMNAAAELAEARVATHSREELLVAAAQASRLLLESSDVMSRMPEVLQLFGEAAGVDRTTLALADVGADGKRWLEIKSQWNAPGVPALEGCNAGSAWNARRADCFCSELAAGRSVFLCGSEGLRADSSIASREAKSSIIVPFLVEGEYAGAVSFDTLRVERRFESAVVAALEIAASVVGAALQRERLVETMRRERETAAELRVAELARANAALRANLERLAKQPTEFFDHALLETCRHAGARSATAIIANTDFDGWTVGSHACDAAIDTPPFAAHVPNVDSPFMQVVSSLRDPLHVELRAGEPLTAGWPELLDYHRAQDHRSLYLLPLVFGDRTLGVVALGFSRHEPLRSELAELLVALGQQITLALAMKRLFNSAKQTAVLAERNRIGREIHDGLAQAFTGILMQLGAAEELAEDSPLSHVMNRIRDIAKEGLTEARRSVLALRPDEPRAGGLELALRQLAERSIVNGRIATRFSGGGATGLPPEHEHALLRIAQEAVINAVRHAQPRQIEIALEQDAEELRLTIRDDGSGLWQRPEVSARQGFGLTNMRERAEDMGGRLVIASEPDAGTTVTVHVPRTGGARR